MGARGFKEDRNAAFEAGDISWAKKMMPGASSDRVVEMAFHKARIECTEVSRRVRLESLAWLRGRGLTRMTGGPLPSEDEIR